MVEAWSGIPSEGAEEAIPKRTLLAGLGHSSGSVSAESGDKVCVVTGGASTMTLLRLLLFQLASTSP